MLALIEPETKIQSYEQSVSDQLRMRLNESQDDLQSLRLQAMSRFEALGFPTRRLEAWKYINVRPLLGLPLTPERGAVAFDADHLQAHLLEDAAAGVLRLVFVNGSFSPALSSDLALEPGVCIGNMKQACEAKPESLKEQLGAYIEEESDAFVALNTALFEDGVFVSVPDGVEVKPLIQALFISTGANERVTYPRNLFKLGRNAKVRMVIQHVGLSNAAYLNNSVNQFVVAEGGHAECTMILNEGEKAWHLAATRSSLQTNAQLALTTVSVSGGVNRHSVTTLLQGENAEARLNGLDVLDGKTEVYHHTVTEHWVPNVQSRQSYKSILDDHSKSEFNSMVFVAKGADGTDSHQLHKCLLLSEDAHVWTRPQLQINADDVKCAHGSAVGQLDEDQLFYLASRGLDGELAQNLLTYGFAEEIIQKITEPAVRQYLDGRILEHMHRTGAAFKQQLGA